MLSSAYAPPILAPPLYTWVQKHGTLLADPENAPTYFLDDTAIQPSFETPDFTAEERIQALRVAQKMVQRKFLFKHRSLRHFSPRKLPQYAKQLVSMFRDTPMKRRFRK